MSLADRDLIDADRTGAGGTCFRQLRLHVLLLQRLDRVPVHVQLLGNVLDRALPATPSHIVGESLRIERIVRQPLQTLPLHSPTTPAIHPPDFHLQVDPLIPAGQTPPPASPPVIPPRLDSPTAPARRFFERRINGMTRALGSPNTPLTVAPGRNPGNL